MLLKTIKLKATTKRLRISTILCLCASFLFVAGCNHLYYYPDDKIYIDPSRPFWGAQSLSLDLGNEIILDALYIPKVKQGPCKNKILVHFHGNAQNLTAHFPLLQWVKNFGMDYFTFDYPGYGKSTGDANQDSIAAAASKVIEMILKGDRPEFRNKQVIFYGQSLGGAVMSHALSRLKDFKLLKRIDKIILESSFASYKEIANRKLKFSWLTWPLQWIPYLLVSDESPLETKVTKGKFPEVLVVHSKQDWVVPYGSGKDLYAAWKQPKSFWTYLGFSHLQLNSFTDYRQRLTKFMCE